MNWSAIPRACSAGLAATPRATVRCLFPLACLGAFAGLLGCDQGRDVLQSLVEFAAGTEHGQSWSGLVFLWMGSILLGLSLWYAMRWLLAIQLPALPLATPPGLLQRWLPRLVGAAPAGLVAGLLLSGLDAPPELARPVSGLFALTALGLLMLFERRGSWIQSLVDAGWLASADGRHGALPGRLGFRQPLPAATRYVVAWTLGATALLGLMFIAMPVNLPRTLGVAALAAIALCSINLFGSFVLTLWPLRRRQPVLAPWVLLWALACGVVNDNHHVAHVDPHLPPLQLGPPQDMALEADFARFLATLPKADGGPPTVYFLASEGGGIRAAYWTAAVLERLREQDRADASPRLQRLYAMSGVSGGALGVAAWAAARRADYCPALQAPSAGVSRLPPDPRRSLRMDFLAPPIAGLLYGDLMQRFLPWPIESLDRSRAMERSWQEAFANLPGQPFERSLADLYRQCPGLPRLMLNTTVVETGQRAVISPFQTPPGQERCTQDANFANTLPIMAADYDAQHQTLAGLTHHSARFPAVSPAGRVDNVGTPGCASAVRLVDGGYFDNSGAQTVLDLIQRLRRAAEARPALAFRPVVLLVRNSPEPLTQQRIDSDIEPSRVAPEAGSILRALLNARASHAVLARAELQRAQAGAEIAIVDLAVSAGSPAARAPLGWALSDIARCRLDADAQGLGWSGRSAASPAANCRPTP